MRQTMPDVIIPPADPDQTPADTPLAREVRAALVGPLHALRCDLATGLGRAMEEFEGRFCTALVDAVTNSKVIRDLRTDVDELKQWRRDTERCGPPSEGL